MCNNNEIVNTIAIQDKDTNSRAYFLERRTNLAHRIYNNKIFYVGMGEIAISPQGDFDLWSPGFSGCTGVIICPKNRNIQGGLIGHIKQNAGPSIEEVGKEGWYQYIFTGICTCIDMVIDLWGNIDVVLFKGEPYLHDPNLITKLQSHYLGQEVVIHDYRIEESCQETPDRPECNLSEVFLDTKNKELYIYGSLDVNAKEALNEITIFSREDDKVIDLYQKIDANDGRIFKLKNHMHLVNLIA
jgi:hypothetical protein